MIRGGIPLETHVVNSILNLTGEGMKVVIRLKPDNPSLFQNIIYFNNEFELVFWKRMTDIIGEIDYEIGFTPFYNMIWSYGAFFIPQILNKMIPYFKNLTDKIKLNELIILQDNLVLEDTI